MAGGRRLPVDPQGLTVVELIARYWDYARAYYRKTDGKETETGNIRAMLKLLRRIYGDTPAVQFGPLAMKVIQQEMVKLGWSRPHINRQMGRIRRMFKWAAAEQLVTPDVLAALQAVAPLKFGRTEAPEPEPVKPVDESHVEATLAAVSPVVAAMVRVQLLTGMRPGEVCIMRGADLDTTGKQWAYRPATHKNQWRGHGKVVYIGPKAQDILRPFLKADLQAYLFSPRESEAWRRGQLHEQRKTPMSCGNKPGSNRKRKPKKKPLERYSTGTYARAIDYACRKAFPPPAGLNDEAAKAWRKDHHWHPNQLRHTAATRIRQQFGAEAAQQVAGHRHLRTTEIYAERNEEAVRRIVAQVG